MELIQASPEDYQKIRAFYDDIIDHTPDIQLHARWMHGLHPSDEGIRSYLDRGAMYLCLDDGCLIGAMAVTMGQEEDYHPIQWAVAARDDEVAVIHILGIAPRCQGKGFGTQMIEEAIRLGTEQGKKALRLDALASNLPAHKLYEAKGFQYRGTQRWYAENTGWTDFYLYEYPLNKPE